MRRWKQGPLALVAASLLVIGGAPVAAQAAAADGSSGSRLCTSAPSLDRNVLVGCDQLDAPHNETAVAANPLNPLNLVVGANDYQEPSATTRTLLSRAHVSMDGGHSWIDVALPYPAVCTFTGDPSLAFDAAGTVYYASLCEDTSAVVVTASHDGGLTWSPMVNVAVGTATSTNDHPQLAAWGRGNVAITWVVYQFTDSGESQLTTAPIVAAVSHDGGQHFGSVQNIGGSSPQCVGLTAPHTCDQTWGNAIAVARDGTVMATFYNTTKYAPDSTTNLERTRHFSVRLNPATGALMAGPFFIGQAYDGLTEGDYPVNTDGHQTMQDSELRILMQGNMAADPLNPKHVAVVWFDDRNAPQLPVSSDPYTAKTNSDIIVSQSYDSGTTWSQPTAIAKPGDQFFPWASYDGLGRLQIGYMDRSYDPNNHLYGYTVAVEQRPGSLQFHQTQVSTALSDPTKDNRWSSTSINANFPRASRFIGDYSGLTTVGLATVAVWTDQRRQSCLFEPSDCGLHGENTYAAVTLLP